LSGVGGVGKGLARRAGAALCASVMASPEDLRRDKALERAIRPSGMLARSARAPQSQRRADRDQI
jgi:predicted dinucleotide-binding enzyme